MRWPLLLMSSFLVLFCSLAVAQEEDEPIAIFEIGGVPNWSLTGSGYTFSPTLAVETTVIKDWLELELGATPTFSHHSTAWDTDLLFKKPWTLSKKVEVMVGVGPTWVRARSERTTTNSIGVEAAVDFMFWPHANRRFGWYMEPAYEYDFNRSRDQSLGFSAGLLIRIGK